MTSLQRARELVWAFAWQILSQGLRLLQDKSSVINLVIHLMTWRVRFHLNIGYLLLGVSWKTCTRKFQMLRTRNSKFMDIFLNKTRIGNFTSGIEMNARSEYDKFQSWKLVHLKSFGSRTMHDQSFYAYFLTLFVAPLISCCSALQSLPDLPEFPLSLRPEGYEFPCTDSIWENVDCQPQIQSLKEHLKDEEEEAEAKWEFRLPNASLYYILKIDGSCTTTSWNMHKEEP
jgi:hypothetical protein